MRPVKYDGWYSHAELTELLQAWAAEAPRLLEVESLGNSYEGREIWLATVTNLDTGHATHLEPGSRMVVPVGTVVTWHVHEPFRKVYAAYEEEWDEHRYY